MRLDRVYIDGFKNLKKVEIDFDQSHLTTVIIGENGSGKSNLIEAIVDVFRFVDLNSSPPRYKYEIDYCIEGNKVKLSNLTGKDEVSCDGEKISRKMFKSKQSSYFPDLVFGYYSGGGRDLEKLFDRHQQIYYDAIKREEDIEKCSQALDNRRLFYCRPIHGELALLSFFLHPTKKVSDLLKGKLNITGFHSALAILHEPWFFNKGKVKSSQEAHNIWGAKGPAGKCARQLRNIAFHPINAETTMVEDYRSKILNEIQLANFVKNFKNLKELMKIYPNDRDFFAALESMDISDLIRELHIWIQRTNDTSGEISSTDLSDGEQQLMMVLGLIRLSRGKRALFLLDEPDTHLNPYWQHSYLELIQQWTEITAEDSQSHIIMTSHNPLTISSLKKEEVRVIEDRESGTSVAPPYTDPVGLGFTATLTEIFGLSSSLDQETQHKLDERNELAKIKNRSSEQDLELAVLNDELKRLGFIFENREPLYHKFLQSLQDTRYANKPILTREQLEKRRAAMTKIIQQLKSKTD